MPFVHHRLEIFGNRQGSLDWMQTSKFRLNILAGEWLCELIFSNRPSGRAARSGKLFFEIWGKAMKSRFAATAVGLALSCVVAAPAKAQLVEQRILANIIQNTLQEIRDPIQSGRFIPPAPGRSRFSAEEPEFDNRNPFAADPGDPFAALAYTKALTKAPPAPPAPVWLYGVNGIVSYDRTTSIGSLATTTTGVVAADITKIGIFTASDALTFLATGSDSWSHIPTSFQNSTMPSGSGTLAYLNGGFSTDFTTTASWTSNSSTLLGIAAPANSSLISYTGNAQYKFDIGHSWFVEPTAGAIYTDFYTANFGNSIGGSTEIHGGGRIGGEIMAGGLKLQPSFSAAAFQIISVSGAGGVAAAGLPNVAAQLNQLGARGNSKLDFIWTSNFTSYIEGHLSSVAGTHTAGVSGGVRYTF